MTGATFSENQRVINRSLVKACALPFLAIVLLGASLLIGTLIGSVTKTNVWIVGDGDHVRSRLFDSSIRDPVYISKEASSNFPSCSGAITKLTIETPSYEFIAADGLNEWLRKSGFEVCEGPVFTYTQVPLSSGLGKNFYGLSWLLLLVLSYGLILLIYRKFGTPKGVMPVADNFMRLFASGLIAAGLLYLIKTLVFDWDSAYKSLPSLAVNKEFLLTIPVVLSIGILIPLIEETAFRAWLIPLASQSVGQVGAVVLSTTMFALTHWIFDWSSFIFYISAGIIFSTLWVLTRSLFSCVLAHGAYNSAIAFIN